MSLIHRVTMFKLNGADKQKQLLAAYEKLSKENKKDGKPYIVYLCAGLSDQNDPRHKGYTVISQTKFKTIEDMKYYDEACEAHQALKATVKGLGPEEPPLSVYFEASPHVDQTHA